MSMFDFIAADKPLDEYSIGIEVLNKNAIRINEDHCLNVYKEDCYFSSAYTDKKHIMGIELDNFNNMAKELLTYIKSQAANHKTIELWSISLDEKDELECKKCDIANLTTEDLKWVYDNDYFDHPKCLTIYNRQA